MTKHPNPRWSMPRDSKKRAEVAAEQAIARYGTASAAQATGLALDVLEAAEARINEAVAAPDQVGRERVPDCGTYAAYIRHRRTEELTPDQIDQPCRDAYLAKCREYERSRASRRKAAA